MRSRRALWALVALALAGVAARPQDAPPANAPSPDMPAECRLALPLPSEFPFAKSEYERILGRFLRAECYARLGWRHDSQLRPTGPTLSTLGGDPHRPAWTAKTWGTHNTVLIYYSPDVFRWMCERDAAGERDFVEECRKECPTCRLDGKEEDVRPIADGSMIVKLMYGDTTEEMLEDPSPAGRPRPGMALMVKDHKGAKDGWWWASWEPSISEQAQLDWPPPVNFPYPWMGFGYYCLNCHASAAAESTFSSLNNVLGDPDDILKFYLQDQPPILGAPAAPASNIQTISAHQQRLPILPGQEDDDDTGPYGIDPDRVNRVSQPRRAYSPDFLKTFGARIIRVPTWEDAESLAMPPEPYDHVNPGPDGAPLFITSDQCVGCHAAGATGLHFNMTLQRAGQPALTGLLNLAPYGEWRSSPMGLAGRDPIFFAQLESERTLHPGIGNIVQDLCLHCHGVMGQRQFCLDQFPGDPKKANEVCNNTALLGLNENSQPIVPRELFSRDMLNAIPYKAVTDKQKRDSKYGALARDGVSCATCHHISIDEKEPVGHTFTGDFRVGAPDVIHGPFEGPQQVPMDHSLGIKPIEYPQIKNSKVCGSCHSVVLPVFDGDKPWINPKNPRGKPEIIIEQATFPEWVFSDFRDGGPTPQSCQECHMANTYPGAGKLKFKIASIQEASDMPQVENRRPMSEIDLKPREPYARHTLVGLNVFFNKIAQQFPDILGIRVQDPMLVGRGVAPLETTFNSMIQQADASTATASVESVGISGDQLIAKVKVENLAGHKFPSGVSFRRAFLEFAVLDAQGNPLWVSGRTSSTGVIVDAAGRPVKGEFFWKSECQPMTAAEQEDWYQPHYEVITRQDQAQIYQELVRDPRGKLTTSFLAQAEEAKDNRLLPRGWMPTLELARQTGLGSPKFPAEALVERVLPDLPDGRGGHVDDPWYRPRSAGGLGGGGDELTYSVPLADLKGRKPASVQVTLYYQSTPPFYLQDRFCTAPGKPDTGRLFFLAGHLNLEDTRAENWKLRVVSSGKVPVAAPQ
ncbi:MAG TPA: hypothetical protein VF789_11115 [Thermoanaerobaculia bacterium]